MTKIDILIQVNEALKQVSVIKFIPVDIELIDLEIISMDDAIKVLIAWILEAINNGLDVCVGGGLLKQLWNVKGGIE